MTTQSQVIETIKKTGIYSASLYKFNHRSIRGLNEVNPARKLTEKGELKLIKEERKVFENGEVIHYTWTKSTNMDEYEKVLARIKKSLTTEESLIELLILLGLSYKNQVSLENVQSNYQYENVFKPLIIDIDSLELEREKIAHLIGDVGRILTNVQTPL